MLSAIVSLLRRHRGYRQLFLGALLSSAGSGLTQVAVYGELARIGVPASWFAAAFAATVLPGLVSSRLGAKLLARRSPGAILVAAEILGAASIALPVTGSLAGSPALLLAAQLASAFLAGLAIPASIAVSARLFRDEELAAASGLSTLAFSSQVLVGYGAGALLYGTCSPLLYFAVDFVSYLFGAAFLLRAMRHDGRLAMPNEAAPSAARQTLRWGRLSPSQRQAFLLLPALTLVGTPAVALLPVLAKSYGVERVASFLFAKTLGQLLGPLVLRPERFDRLLRNRLGILGGMVAFSLLYVVVAFGAAPLWLALALVCGAHVVSNMVYGLATYAVPRHFGASEAGEASSLQYQAQIALMATTGLAAGKAADRFASGPLLAVHAILALSLVAGIFPQPDSRIAE